MILPTPKTHSPSLLGILEMLKLWCAPRQSRGPEDQTELSPLDCVGAVLPDMAMRRRTLLNSVRRSSTALTVNRTAAFGYASYSPKKQTSRPCTPAKRDLNRYVPSFFAGLIPFRLYQRQPWCLSHSSTLHWTKYDPFVFIPRLLVAPNM